MRLLVIFCFCLSTVNSPFIFGAGKCAESVESSADFSLLPLFRALKRMGIEENGRRELVQSQNERTSIRIFELAIDKNEIEVIKYIVENKKIDFSFDQEDVHRNHQEALDLEKRTTPLYKATQKLIATNNFETLKYLADRGLFKEVIKEYQFLHGLRRRDWRGRQEVALAKELAPTPYILVS